MFQDSAACDLEYSKYHVVAEGYGGKGFELASTEDDIQGAVRQAQEAMKEGKPALINAYIGGTNFREGSLSV
jgi:acetolactate synthase-like protein